MRTTTLIRLGIILGLPGMTLAQVQIEVLQGGISKGTFTTYSGAASAATNFGYTPFDAFPAIGPASVVAEEQIFFYRETGSGNLFFNAIFRPGNETTNSNRFLSWDIAVDHSGGAPHVVASDDANELNLISTVGGTTTFEGRWEWIRQYSDGGVIGPLLGNWEIRIDPILYGGQVGTEDIKVYGPGGSSIALVKNTTQQIVFRPVAVPDAGSSLLLLALGLAGLLSARRIDQTRERI